MIPVARIPSRSTTFVLLEVAACVIVAAAIVYALLYALIVFIPLVLALAIAARHGHRPGRGRGLVRELVAGGIGYMVARERARLRPASPTSSAPRRRPRLIRVRGEVYASVSEAREAADWLQAEMVNLPATGPERRRLAEHVEELRKAADAEEDHLNGR